MRTRIGTVDVEDTGVEERIRGGTPAGESSEGPRRRFKVTDNDGLVLQLADTRWANGERDVRVLKSQGPLQIVQNLTPDHFRLSIRMDDNRTSSAALQQARVKLNTQQLDAGLFPATAEQLNQGSGIDVDTTLRGHGADSTEVHGTRTRVVFPSGDVIIPALVFVASRVLPLKNMWWAKGTNKTVDFDLAGTTSPIGPRCYVIALDRTADPDAGPLGCVYVGQTGVLIPQRFRQHKVGYRSSKSAKRFGLRLMPELYEGRPRLPSKDAALEAEAELADTLRHDGYTVFGGH